MSERSNRALVATTAVAAATGCFLTWKLYRQWQRLQKKKEKSLSELATNIDAEDLAVLTRSDNTVLKKSAEQVLVDRMMSEENLNHLLNKCASDDEEEMKKATTVLSILTKTNEFKSCLVVNKAFEIVIDCVKRISDGFQIKTLADNCHRSYEIEHILKYSIVTICDLVEDSETNLTRFFNSSKEFVAFLLEMISCSSDSISQDIRRLCILILQQMMQNENMRVNLISYGMIQRTTLCFLRSIGDTWLSKNCLQILVMYINFFEDYVTEEFLQEMAQLGIVPVLIGCLKFDDSDLVYWSAALIHEFLLKDLHRGIISKIPDITNTFYQILISSEAGLQRLILRIFCFLSINDDNFKTKLSNYKPLLKRLSICLASGNNDLVYWALLLVHDLAMMGKDVAFKLIKANPELLKSVIALTENSTNALVDTKLVAETLGFFCSCENLNKRIVEAGCLKSIIKFLKSDNTDLQFWATSLLLNLAMSSDEARVSMIKEGGIRILLEMAVKESEMPQITAQASKILVMLGFSGAILDITLKSGADSSIMIEGKEYSPMKDGINVVALNFMDFKVCRGITFDPRNSMDVNRLVKLLSEFCKNELVIITTQGCVNSHLQGLSTNELLSSLEMYGLQVKNLDDDGAWCILAQAHQDHSVHPLITKQGLSDVIATTSVSLALQTNKLVRDELLEPLLDILMRIPAGSKISKVPELGILSTLARHQEHQKEPGQLSLKPLMIAHCVGSLKIVHSLSTNSELCDELVQSFVIGAIKSFLFTTCHVFISEMKCRDLDIEGKRRHRSLFSPNDDVFLTNEKGGEIVKSRRNKNSLSNNVADGDLVLGSITENERNLNSGQSSEYDREKVDGPRKPLGQINEIEALIAQVTSEKTFGDNQNDELDSNLLPGSELVQGSIEDEHTLVSTTHLASGFGSQEDVRGPLSGKRRTVSEVQSSEENVTATAVTRPKRQSFTSSERNDSRLSNRRCDSTDNNRGASRSSERSKSPVFSKRAGSEMDRETEEEDEFYYDDFEEEDLPNLPENEEDNFAESQGRLFFDIPRMASAQRMRSSSAFDPNDWPTTRSGSLSRALTEAAQRCKSPLKDIAADLEDFDEALLNMTNYSLMTVYFCLKNRNVIDLKTHADISKILYILWCVMLSCRASKKLQFGMIISALMSKLTTMSSFSDSQELHSQDTVLLDKESLTSSMIISNDLLEIYNGNWTFESAHATHCIGKHMSGSSSDARGWYYEVSLFSSGIMQIGWATHGHGFHFEPERGLGVGDCLTSVGFDGSRCKIWNGPIGEDDPDNKYGRSWKIGDTVSCLLAVDGDVSFWLNGQDLGVAIKNLGTNLLWYPAASLSLDQHCRFNCGIENFMYQPPKGFLGVQEAVELTRTKPSRPEWNSPSSKSNTELDMSRYSKDGSSYSSYEFLEASTDRVLSSNDASFTSTRKQLSSKQLQSKSSFSPRDLIDSNGSDLSEVMYYEVKIPQNSKEYEIEIGFQSTITKRKISFLLQGNNLTLLPSSNSNEEQVTLQCLENFGCGLLWPVKKLFLTTDGVGSQLSVDLKDLGNAWTENLDEIVPFFSAEKLQINFGQYPFLCQAMNSFSYKKKFCQLIYNIVLKSEASSED